ncbi:MAG: C25 family cysteine peptidase [Ignavibacteriaceae bacterium]|nr:C25 family cysteine peptidase [Ignavibacteriaceae bacterium]
MRYVLVYIVLLVSSQGIFAQNYSWVEPGETYLKFYTVSDGIHRIDYNDFLNSGVNPSTINPKTLKVIYRGNEVPVYVAGESNEVFEPGEFLDVYCTRNYGGVENYYNLAVIQYTKDEYYNLYSDTNVYWISWGGANGRRFDESPLSANVPYEFSYFEKYFHAENDVVYSLGEKNSSTDYRNFSNELVIGEGWYWREMQRNAYVADTFSLQGINPQVQNFKIKLFAYPNSASTSIAYEHWLIAKVNGVITDTIKSDNYNKLDTTLLFPTSLLNPNSVNIINFTYSGPTGFNGRLYFDFFRTIVPANFEFENGSITFESQNQDSASRIFNISGYNSGAELNIYDIKNSIRITNFTQNGNSITFSGKGNGKFLIENKTISRKPFRIEQKVLPDLISTTNGADFIVVYPDLFSSQAEQLRLHRETFSGLRSVKVKISDIYDIFNFGLEDPAALRNFMSYVYSNWQAPKVKYLCLFGRGSVDPKMNLATSQYYRNHVPVWGNPVTDNYFVNFTTSTFAFVPKVAVGRIPVYTVQEAQEVTDKIIAYDLQPNDRWNKNHTFITGGFNHAEQLQFASQSDAHISNYITSKPVRGVPVRIYRNDSTGQVSFNFQDSILKVIDAGTLLVNYIGHAATSFWDNGIEDPSIVNNIDKLSFIMSFTCFTGKFAEGNERAFGEKFLLLPDKGAIGFIGSTGWSFVISGNTMNGNVFRAYSYDNLRSFGDLMKRAAEYMVQDTASFSSRNMINCYGLIGDPAQELKLPNHPELALLPNDYSLSKQYPSLAEDVTMNVTSYNFGNEADSVKINFKLKRNGSVKNEYDTIFYNLGFTDTIPYEFVMDTLGVYTIDVTIDPDNWYSRDDPNNNKIIVSVPLRNVSYVPLKPVDNQVFGKKSIKVTGLNPAVDHNNSDVTVIVQIDTTVNFNSSFRLTYFDNEISGVATSFNVNIPLADTGIVYYWRTNAIVNGDSSGWSEIRRFTYNPEFDALTFGSKVINAEDSDSGSITVLKNLGGQFDSHELNGVEYNNSLSGLTLQTFNGNILARSHGANAFDASYFKVNNSEFFLINDEYMGYNFVKLRKIDGKILEVKNFKMTSGTSSDSIVNFLNTFNSNNILIVVKGYPANQNLLQQNARDKIRQFGSNYADSVNNFLDKWSFISIPDSNGGFETAEAFFRYDGNWVPAECEIETMFTVTTGKVSQVFGTADSWTLLSWQYDIVSSSNSFVVNIFGIREDGNEELLFGEITNQTEIDLTGVNSFTYPQLKMSVTMSMDTINPVGSPVLRNIKMKYLPPGELIPDQNSITLSSDRILYGDTVRVSLNIYNEGYNAVNGILNRYSFISSNGSEIKIFDTLQATLQPGDSISSTVLFDSEEFNSAVSNPGLVNVVFESKPLNNQNQLVEFNDYAFTQILISPDSISPQLDITFDGAKVINGDFIAVKPDIQIIFSDDGVEEINPGDTLLVRIKLNNQPVPYFIGTNPNPEITFEVLDNIVRPRLKINFKPELGGGTNRFEFITRDQTGNIGDSVSLRLTVDAGLGIKDLLNYPNPMKDKTVFAFKLSGAETPGSCKINIYTVAGRLVKVIESSAHIGYNEIEWDGRDNDGDLMANGVYFYRMIIEGQGDKEGSTQRLVILR